MAFGRLEEDLESHVTVGTLRYQVYCHIVNGGEKNSAICNRAPYQSNVPLKNELRTQRWHHLMELKSEGAPFCRTIRVGREEGKGTLQV